MATDGAEAATDTETEDGRTEAARRARRAAATTPIAHRTTDPKSEKKKTKHEPPNGRTDGQSDGRRMSSLTCEKIQYSLEFVPTVM